jgi:outer membrane protein OmpA-like peptidoglycan-associated protein
MKTAIRNIVPFSLALILFSSAQALDRSGFDELRHILDSARVMEADVFAPKAFEKAEKSYENARIALDTDKRQKTLDKWVDESREYAENALKATEVARLSLQEYLGPRERANEAQAPKLVPELYAEAEKQFIKATEKVESGDVKGALKEADKASPLFDTAELEAIRADILGAADRLIEKAVADDAEKYALATLDKARTARTKADGIITNDRYNRTEAVQEAKRAEYEARHASNIALSVRALNRNDQAWEKLMLVYEIQMNRVGEAIGLKHLPFDNGPLAAADTLINYIKNLQAGKEQLSKESENLASDLTEQLKETLALLDVTAVGNDPADLAQELDKRVSDLLVEKNTLAEQVQASSAELARLSEEHEEIAAELTTRTEREEKFKKAKMMLNPSEGEVLFNSSNDIVLRLSGLSFDVGKSDIKDEHIPLLSKVQEVIRMFPEAQLVVEGHTDASGEAAANVTLSEKRAFEVMQYLRQSLLIPADKIQSIGYGAERPVASNQTADGRAKNRRIDIIIMQ